MEGIGKGVIWDDMISSCFVLFLALLGFSEIKERQFYPRILQDNKYKN